MERGLSKNELCKGKFKKCLLKKANKERRKMFEFKRRM